MGHIERKGRVLLGEREKKPKKVGHLAAHMCILPPPAIICVLMCPYGQTSRVWDSLLARKSGCAGGPRFAPRLGQ